MKTLTIGVLHLVDSLTSGGTEHMAVMLANNLPQEHYRAYLCASRRAGQLKSLLKPQVVFIDLRRKGRFDIFAIIRLSHFIHCEHINIIHAHSSSLFLGAILGLINPQLHLVWHDHFGLQNIEARPTLLYLPFARRVHAVFTVTRDLADWSIRWLGVSKERVHYLPNFVEGKSVSYITLQLPGKSGKRIVCVANVREQKDHLTLVRALAQVVESDSDAHLILVGMEVDIQLKERVRQEIRCLGVESNLTWLGLREDVPSILAQCDIGVLSSISEGFPVVLLEYGRAELAVVATQVGECAEILDEGEAGILVPPSNPDYLATALLRLLNSPALRNQFGKRLAERVEQNYSAETITTQLCHVYECLVDEGMT